MTAEEKSKYLSPPHTNMHFKVVFEGNVSTVLCIAKSIGCSDDLKLQETKLIHISIFCGP